MEPFVDEQERLDLSHLLHGSSYWGLRVTGDSMIEDLITDGDLAIMRSLDPDETLKKGEIVAARVEGVGTTLKRYYQEGEMVMLKPSNLNYQPIELNANQIQVQGILIGVWRGY